MEEKIYLLKSNRRKTNEKIEETKKNLSENKNFVAAPQKEEFKNPFIEEKRETEKKFDSQINKIKQEIESSSKALKEEKNKKEFENRKKKLENLTNELENLKSKYQRELKSIQQSIDIFETMNAGNNEIIENNCAILENSFKTENSNLERENVHSKEELRILEEKLRDSEAILAELRREQEKLRVSKLQIPEGLSPLKKEKGDVKTLQKESQEIERRIQEILEKNRFSNENQLVSMDRDVRNLVLRLKDKIMHLKEVTGYFENLRTLTEKAEKDGDFNVLGKKLSEII